MDDVRPNDAALLQLFGQHQEARNLSPETQKRIRVILVALRRDTGTELADITGPQIEAWLAAPRASGQKLAARTRSTYISYLASFYGWALRSGFVDGDPTTELIRPRLSRRLPRPMRDTHLAQALEAVDDPRMRLWLCLGAYGGLRAKEIAGLRAEDLLLDADPPMIFVAEGKGGHQREVPLNPLIEEALAAYDAPAEGYLFTGLYPDHPLRPATVTKYVTRFMRSQGIPATTHRLRHWFGTNVYARTRDLRLTQELLGHSDPSTTAIYTKVVAAEGSKVVRQLGQPIQAVVWLAGLLLTHRVPGTPW